MTSTTPQATVRLVARMIGCIAALSLLGAVALTILNRDAAQAWTICGAATGSLGTLLASTRSPSTEVPGVTTTGMGS